MGFGVRDGTGYLFSIPVAVDSTAGRWTRQVSITYTPGPMAVVTSVRHLQGVSSSYIFAHVPVLTKMRGGKNCESNP